MTPAEALDYAEAYMLRGERPRVDLGEVVRVLRGRDIEARRLECSLDALPEQFSASVFVFAGLPLAMASTALMVARRVLEDAERSREAVVTPKAETL
jgi:hypothetical protein